MARNDYHYHIEPPLRGFSRDDMAGLEVCSEHLGFWQWRPMSDDPLKGYLDRVVVLEAQRTEFPHSQLRRR